MKHFIIFYTFESSEKKGSGCISLKKPIFPNHREVLDRITKFLEEQYFQPPCLYTVGITSILPITEEEFIEYAK